MLSLVLIAICALLSAVLVILQKKLYDYWRDRGIPFVEPKFPYGNMFGVGKDQHMGEIIQKIYLQHKDAKVPFVGGFMLTQPLAVVTDLDLAKNIMIKDFNYFADRPVYYNERDDPLSAHIFNMDGPRWRDKRMKLTPTFTTAKMRNMSHLVLDVARNLEKTMLRKLDETGGGDGGCVLEMKDIVARYTTDVIGSCVFGFDSNTLENENFEFRRYGNGIFISPRHETIWRVMFNVFPNLGRTLRMKIFTDDTTKYFLNIIKEMLHYRNTNNIQRNDFLDLMKNGTSRDRTPLTLKEITAESLLFLFVGFETSAATIAFALYCLALDPAIQERTREDINEALAKHDGHLSYDSIKDMTYLNQVLQETQRKYPVIPVLSRKTLKDYPIEGTPYQIEKGVFVNIPVYGFHKDPEIWPDPEKFDPSRFEKQNVANRHPAAFIPFGIGPRNCIGARFGIFQTSVALAVLLKSFRFSVCPKTPIPAKWKPNALAMSFSEGTFLMVERVY